MNKLTQKELDYLATQGIDRRINEWNVIHQTTEEDSEKRKALKNIVAYQNIKKSLLVD